MLTSDLGAIRTNHLIGIRHDTRNKDTNTSENEEPNL